MILPRVGLLSLVLSLGSLGLSACAPPASRAATPVGFDAIPDRASTSLAPPPPGPSPALLVLSKRDETLSIVDPASLKVVARIPVGHDPHEVIANAGGTLAYVTNYGHGTLSTLAVVDLVSQQRKPAIELGGLRGPHGLAYAGDKVWFTAEGAKAIATFDPARGAIDWILGTGQDRTHMMLVGPDLGWVVTSNVASGTLSFLERKAAGGGGPPPDATAPPGGPRQAPPGVDWQQTLVTVGVGTEGLDVAPDGHEIWAADADDGTIAIVDVASKKLVQRVAADVRGANRLKFTPDGKWVLVSSLRGPDLVVLDAATRTAAKRVPLGHGAAGILVQPDGARAYVSCTPDGYVAVVDLRTMAVVGKVAAGNEPDGLAWAVRR